MLNNRILIGIPCYGDVAPEVLEDYMRFAFHLGRRLPQYDVELGIRTKAEQFRARNAIVEGAIATNCDRILMLDDDMILNALVTNGPSDAYGFLERLIAHDKDIVGALYYQKVGQCAPVLMRQYGERGYRFLRDDEITHGLQRVDVAGGGCLLIKTKVFDHLTFPFFGPEYEYGTDVQLCRQAAAKGFEVWADTSLELGHLKPERTIITSRNRYQYQLEDQTPGEVKQTFVSAALYDDLIRDAAEWTGFPDLDTMTAHAGAFMDVEKHRAHLAAGGSDLDWYRQFPKERVGRQVWFNTTAKHKRTFTQWILNTVDQHKPLDILDFGCGIGIPAFTFAQKGHRETAMDVDGTGTLDFLAWRAQKHHVDVTIARSRALVPALGSAQYDVIVAMDCLEHFQDWRAVLRELVAHLKSGGVLFANNAVLDDTLHAEHYPLPGKDFVQACLELGLNVFNQITYVKEQVPSPTELGKKLLVHA